MRRKSFAASLLAVAACCSAVAAAADALTVADAIQTTRFMTSVAEAWTRDQEGQDRISGTSEVFVCPDKRMWAALLIRGDLAKNGNWAEVLTGSLQSLDEAVHPRVVARFFTHSFGDGKQGGSVQLTLSINPQPLQWLGDCRQVALLWDDGSGRNQIFTVDVKTSDVRQVSRHPTSINAFTHYGSTFLYNADYEPAGELKSSTSLLSSSAGSHAKGVTIETRNLGAVLQGHFDGNTEGRYFEWRILDRITGKSTEIRGLNLVRHKWTGAAFSHDGRFAVVDSSPTKIPEQWDLYTEPFWRRAIQRARRNRNDGVGRQLKQLYVVDVRQGTARPLWNAPSMHGTKIAWSPDGRAVAMSPAFAPAEQADAEGLSGLATVIVDLPSGRFRTIPVPAEVATRAAPSLRWVDPATIELQDEDGELYHYRERNGEWERVAPSARTKRPVSSARAAIEVLVEEGLNTPPALIGVERTSGRRRVIFDPNPQLKHRFTLGRVEMISWRDPAGRIWTGQLYYPVNWQAGRRYPLVIQTAARPDGSQKFSLYGLKGGPGLGPGLTVSAAQPLANRGIAVLNTERKELPGVSGTSDDAPMHSAAYEAAIDHMDRIGLVDRQRVGISGFSNTGYLVQYALVHSTFHYAAAITDDNFDGSYFQAVAMGSRTYANVNGAEPYGAGLQIWVQRAPGFNADKVSTPLRLQVTTPGPTSIMGSWEMFTRLRELNKPVEYFLIPDLQWGSHGIQNPSQCLASQEGAVDWFDFWLNNHEDPTVEKADQYVRWRKLRAQHDIALQSLRSPYTDPHRNPLRADPQG